MIPYERQEKILELLKEKDFIKIDEINIGVSVSTLRRDLKELDKMGKIEYLFGGAVKLCSSNGELPIFKKYALNTEKKEAIAKRAVQEIYVGDIIYLDSGSSCSILLKHIINKKIKIYTTNSNIFNISGNIESEIILIGGNYNPLISSLSGALTEDTLQNLYFDKSFLGVNGVDEDKGVTTPNLTEAMKKKLIKRNSKKTYLLCDSTKYHQVSYVKVFDLKDVIIISDKQDDKLSEYVTILT